jgi:hypothetical protein
MASESDLKVEQDDDDEDEDDEQVTFQSEKVDFVCNLFWYVSFKLCRNKLSLILAYLPICVCETSVFQPGFTKFFWGQRFACLLI